MARKILIGRRDFVRQPGVVWSGGSWGLPLSNLADIRPQFVAEAADNEFASTQFTVDLGAPRKVGVFFFANLRASSNGLLQLKASLAADLSSPTYDTGVRSCWPSDVVPANIGNWGVWNLSGLYNADFYFALGLPRFFVPSAVIDARYIQVTIRDRTNVDPLQIGCFGACEIWEPPYNFRYDWSITSIDDADLQRVPFGSVYIQQRGRRRRLSFGFQALPESEFLARQLDLTLVKGKSEPLVVVPFPESSANNESIEKTAIYGLIGEESAISNPYFARYAQSFVVDQLI